MAMLDMNAVRAYYAQQFPVDIVQAWLDGVVGVPNTIWSVSNRGQYASHTTIRAALERKDTVELHVTLQPNQSGKFTCLVLDLDLNDKDGFYRPCCRFEKKVCKECIVVAWRWVNLLKLMIMRSQHLKESDVVCVFSGSRGIHIWIKLPSAVDLNGRTAIYASFQTMHTKLENIYNLHEFLWSVPIDFIKAALHMRAPILRDGLSSVTDIDSVLHLYASTKACKKGSMPLTAIDYLPDVYKLLFPLVYDRNVSSDTSSKHNIRIPASINSKEGGRVAIPLSQALLDLSKGCFFSPQDILSGTPGISISAPLLCEQEVEA